MFKTTKLLLTLIIVFVFSNSLSAQIIRSPDNNERQKLIKKEKIVENQWEKFFASANESAIFNDGKVVFMKLPTDNGREKSFTFEHAKDGRSFVMIDESGIRLQVFLNKNKRISSVIMPNGEKAIFNWKKTTGDFDLLESVKFDGKNDIHIQTDVPRGGGSSTACRDALFYTGIAFAVCAATGGGLSPACWAATANAAYHALKCAESNQ